MSGHSAQVGDSYAAQVVPGGCSGLDDSCDAPRFYAEFECLRPDGSVAWRTTMKNVVVNQGKGEILNKLFGCTGNYTASVYMGLHSVTTASNHVLSNITASEVGGYATSRPNIAFNSTYTAGSASASASFGFTTSTYTVSGAFLALGTTNSGTGATAGVEYSEGNFAASQQVQSGNTLNVTVTVSYA